MSGAGEIPEAHRASSQPGFWDERYGREAHLFGVAPDPFVAAEAYRIPAGGDVVELGAGEGRNAVYLARQGHYVTVVDFSEVALRKAGLLAHGAGVSLRLVQANLAGWNPVGRWEAVVATFVQLLPGERERLWRLITRILEPGGVFLGVFFRPEQLTGAYPSGGPTALDRLVTPGEIRAHFPDEGLLLAEEAEVDLAAGPHLRGLAAVTQVVYRQPG